MTNRERDFTDNKRMLFDKYYAKLNEKQREAVYRVNGPLLVLAGAGSGKTTVLVNRIAQIILFGNAFESNAPPAENAEEAVANALSGGNAEEMKSALALCADDPCPPDRVLCITFTNKAANEFKERLSLLLGEQSGGIWAGTFHSVCVRILRRCIDRLGYDRSFTIYDSDDSKKLVSEILKKLSIPENVMSAKTAHNEISRLKNNGIFPDEFAEKNEGDIRSRKLSQVYSGYQAALKSGNALDFDDIILLTNLLLESEPEVLEYYCRKFRYILVDEYQDTNPSQSKLIYMLAGARHNVCVVGDDDQSIYGFRGATVENILNFGNVFPEAVTVRLEQNYRSTGNILSAANGIISHNSSRLGKELWTDAGEGEPVLLKKQYTQSEEATYIVSCIRSKVASHEYTYGDFAVLFRMNAQSNALEIIFSKSRIPYRVFGGVRFYERREIKDIVAYLAVIANKNDVTRLKRIINMPKRGIGNVTISELEALAGTEGISLFEAMKRAASGQGKSATKLAAFCELLDKFEEYSKTLPLSELVEKVMTESGYMQMLAEDEPDSARADNLKELISSAISYSDSTETPSLSGFLEDIALVGDTDNYDSNADAVTLMTVHSAKGLEFPVVFIPGFEESIFPSRQSMEEPNGIEEERRLAYVAITRAKKQVVLLHANTRLLFGRTSSNPISRFVEEIPGNLLGEAEGVFIPHGSESKRRYTSSQESFRRNTSPRSEDKPKSESSVFAEGTRVVHAIFGAGSIVSAQILGGDVLYEVAFDRGGTKRLMGTYAKLSKENK